jgi:hypothetical protein
VFVLLVPSVELGHVRIEGGPYGGKVAETASFVAADCLELVEDSLAFVDKCIFVVHNVFFGRIKYDAVETGGDVVEESREEAGVGDVFGLADAFMPEFAKFFDALAFVCESSLLGFEVRVELREVFEPVFHADLSSDDFGEETVVVQL